MQEFIDEHLLLIQGLGPKKLRLNEYFQIRDSSLLVRTKNILTRKMPWRAKDYQNFKRLVKQGTLFESPHRHFTNSVKLMCQ